MRAEASNVHLGRTREDSVPFWPQPVTAPSGAPNIVVILMDDMGYSDPGCFGSEIDTPHIDALAARGLRFSHYTTHPICSAARAALLTGSNGHAVGCGWVSENNPGYPGYVGEIDLDAPTLAETLRDRGYETIMTGKWHNTPLPDTVPSGPKHSWPTQRGFETFYGFMGGETHFFFPTALMLNNRLLPLDEYPRDYYATDDWMDKGIQYLRELRASSPTKPFFLYVANNAVHAPLQAKPGDMAKYRGHYVAGWNALRQARLERQKVLGLVPQDARLAPADPAVPEWDSISPEDRPFLERHMEAYAGMLDCVDQNVGKLVDHLRAIGELDNTIIVFTSDNGGTDAGGPIGAFNNNRRHSGLPALGIAAERKRIHELGGPSSVALYPTGWGQACNTPFSSYKTYTGGGGRRVSFIMSWPARIQDHGAVRSQFCHVTDLMPTLLDLAGLAPLEAMRGKPARPMDGRTFAPLLFDVQAAPSRHSQYYECWANRAYFEDGWVACSIQKRGTAIDMNQWTLHELASDFSEGVDCSREHPQRLAAMIDAFDNAAWANKVYPLDNRSRGQMHDVPPHREKLADVPRTYRRGMQTVHRADILPLISNRSYRIHTFFHSTVADLGVLWAIGDPIGGMVMYLEDGRLWLHYNGFGEEATLPGIAIKEGGHQAVFEYEARGDRTGRGRVLLDGAECEWTDLSPTMSYGIFEGLDVGIDRRGPVSMAVYERYGAFEYTGAISHVTIEPGERAER